jgi:type IV pilus assembly protein PilC
VQTEVNVGTSLAQAMQNTGVFPNMVVMTQIGEESGSLDSMLSKVADYYEREVDETVDALSSLLEPIMVILGVIIGGIVIAIYRRSSSWVRSFKRRQRTGLGPVALRV